MASNHSNVWLGFVDEPILDKHKPIVNFTTNKIGDMPDWPSGVCNDNPACPLCQLPRPLVVQVYAPLDSSSYHRTLYLFCCINPNCWNQSESWTCIRSQTSEQLLEETCESATASQKSTTDWCQDADDWDDNNANFNEENGNLINPEKISDEDEESCSLEESIKTGFEHLTVDDRNANSGITAEAQGGAVGRQSSPQATAEIEGDEGEIVSIDTPTRPQRDLASILQEATPLPQDLYSRKLQSKGIQFVPFFITVWEETFNSSTVSTDRHVRELLQEYQQRNAFEVDEIQDENCRGDAPMEKYEKSIPAHGDKMFHHFISKIQLNSGQIMRYSRGSTSPLLLKPISEFPRCIHCQGETVFEFQILPTVIPKLKLPQDAHHITRVEFGNVLVFTCRKSCWATQDVFKQETVVIQTERF